MNKKALDDYDTLEWDAAKKTLLEALMAGKKAGLENHPVMARTYVHLGAVYITGSRTGEKAMQSFVRALEIDPASSSRRGSRRAEVNDAFAEAKRQGRRRRGGGGGGDAVAAAAEAPARAGHGGGGASRLRRARPRARRRGRAGRATNRASRTCPSASTRSTARPPTRRRSWTSR